MTYCHEPAIFVTLREREAHLLAEGRLLACDAGHDAYAKGPTGVFRMGPMV